MARTLVSIAQKIAEFGKRAFLNTNFPKTHGAPELWRQEALEAETLPRPLRIYPMNPGKCGEPTEIITRKVTDLADFKFSECCRMQG